jgi:hypothetical protein
MKLLHATLGAALSLGAAHASAAPVLLSEVFYDAVGSDDGLSFVEIWGAPGTSLSGLTIEAINGAGGGVTHTLTLSGAIGANGLFVIADNLAGGATTLVANADLILDFDFQNGPDSVALRGAGGILDAVGYGTFAATDVFAGEGSPSVDPAAGSAIARRFANVDTNDNAADWLGIAPTPGSAPIQAVPEPSPLLLFGSAAAFLLRRRLSAPATV